MSERTFTVKEIRKYLEAQESFGDALYFCKEEFIVKANQSDEEE